MKLRKLKNIKYNLLNYELIKIKFYLGVNKIFFYFFNSKYILGFRNQFSVFEMIYIKSSLKKKLKLIYTYHIENKKILFIGFSDLNCWTKFKLIIFKSKHFVTSNFWINGFLNNKAEALKGLQKKIKKFPTRVYNELFCLKTTPDLVVFLTNNSFKIPFQEINNLQIPSILLLNNFSKKYCLNYKVFGNFTSYKSQIFLYLLLKSLLTFKKNDVETEKVQT
jgi:ribosomal protein S2